MSAVDAAYRLAHRYPGGVPALAARAGMSPNTLQHKLNPHCATHHLYIEDAELLTALTGAPDIAHALALACSHVCVPVAAHAASADATQCIATLVREFADVAQAAADALRDGRVTRRELARYDEQFAELVSAAVELRERLAALMPRP